MIWKPLFEKLQAEHADGVLHEGVPDWLWSSLWDWVAEHVRRVQYGSFVYDVNVLRLIERQCRKSFDWDDGGGSATRSLELAMSGDQEFALEVVHLLLSTSAAESQAQSMAVMLHQAGSAWRVAPSADGPGYGLQRRVDSVVQERYDEVAYGGRPAAHLRLAWDAVYGRAPDASTTYREAVKAVEAAAAPVISPDDSRATLGKMIAALRDAPHKWAVPLGGESEGPAVLREMMAGVWRGQHDRHGTADEAQPISVSLREAEAALHVAITLVHLFESGLVTQS